MAVHYLNGPRGLGALIFGTGWVDTVCGTQVPAGNGPVQQDADCRDCKAIVNNDQPRGYFCSWL
jgi:hypothetical protein